MRWVCIYLPQLALDGVLRNLDDPLAPLVLVEGPSQRRIIRAANGAARLLGLRPGQSLAAAHLLTRDFATVEYDPAEVQRHQRFLAAWAYRYSSRVSMRFSRTLLLEVESSLNLFGPWPRFEQRLRSELTALGFSHRLAVAPNPAAARVLCNVHDGLAVDEESLRKVLDQMPIDRLGLPRESVNAFQRMGLRTLHQVLSLPRAGLARRFPEPVLQHLDKLLGRRPLVLDSYAPPDRFDQSIELNYDVESIQALLFPLRRLTSDLGAFLAGRDCGVQRYELFLQHAEGVETEVPVGLLRAERDAALLFELAKGRLERLCLPAAVRRVRLVAGDLPKFIPEHMGLFEERPHQSIGWEQLRERLRARLGDSAVHGVCMRPDHRPEMAWLAETGAAATPQNESPRPGWLLRQPMALEGTPRLLAGPERIESGWWDGGDVRRDYYLIETKDGRLGWAYRDVGRRGPWVLQGWFS
ncbi:Y-family DNA polymerase [Stutzerimonas tarimensis]|uniref:Y-family DNA polymerase n=1 Tax=Stutzerimonas tarimensis TaxID=1507735 RepID=A0ABV7T2H5_9GAMM